jgi:hypothetical protein
MKNMKIVFVVILMMAATVSCAQNTDPLIGKWYFESRAGQPCIVEFTKTKMISYYLIDDKIEEMDYRTDGKTIFCSSSKYADSQYSYSIQNGNVIRMNLIMNNITFKITDVGKKIQTNVTALTGKYELLNDVGIIQVLEFTDKTTLIAYSDFAGFTQKVVFKYKISGSNLIITGDRGSIVLEIIGDIIIKGDVMQGGIGQGRESIFLKE